MSIYAAFAKAWLLQRPSDGPAQKEFDRGFDDGLQNRTRNPPDDLTLRESYDAGYDAGTWRSDGGDDEGPEDVGSNFE